MHWKRWQLAVKWVVRLCPKSVCRAYDVMSEWIKCKKLKKGLCLSLANKTPISQLSCLPCTCRADKRWMSTKGESANIQKITKVTFSSKLVVDLTKVSAPQGKRQAVFEAERVCLVSKLWGFEKKRSVLFLGFHKISRPLAQEVSSVRSKLWLVWVKVTRCRFQSLSN